MFQQIILQQYLKQQNETDMQLAYQQFCQHFHDPNIQQNIRQSKEEQYQEGFLRDLFVNILGYTLNPAENYNLTTEFKNLSGAKKADGAILKDGKALAVIELKGMDTSNLDSIEQQAFGYKNHHPSCRYVITANFQKLRFYIDNAVEFVEFDLFKLTFEQFCLLYLLVSAVNLLGDLPLKLKAESLSQEEKVTKALYKDYSQFKRELFADLRQQNPNIDPLVLFNKSQKLLDRLLFIFFAEDSNLLPANTARRMTKEWQQAKTLHIPLTIYQHLKNYFGYLDRGYKDEHGEIFAYNGGLFKSDDVLDSLIISDELLYTHIVKLSDYDFASDVDVNILGHIFENSLNEIDEIKAELRGESAPNAVNKRKQDGVYYTPKYITSYIVQHTLGKLCQDKKAELAIVDSDYYQEVQFTKTGKKKKQDASLINPLADKLKTYRDWLLDIRICDPACGSGAFLNEALNFLIAEHQHIDELERNLYGDSLLFPDVQNHILENNLFGVDINEESIEIAKLSLWLRTAEPHRKLSTLSNNLKCGNSLISDPEIAGDKAFNWQAEFPEVFKNGGFDVVIGNPPYGAKLDSQSIDFIIEQFKNCGLGKNLSDTYIAFYILALNALVKLNGYMSYIAPNTWRLIKNADVFRQFMLSKQFTIKGIAQHTEKVFEEATVDVDTLIIQKTAWDISPPNIDVVIGNIQNEYKQSKLSQEILAQQEIVNLFLNNKSIAIKQKMEQHSVFLKDVLLVKNGVKPYEKGKGTPKQTAETLKIKPYTSEKKLDDSFQPLIGGSNFYRYQLLWNNDNWIKYGEWLAAPRDKEIFSCDEKLIFRQTSDCIIGNFISAGYVMRNNTHIVLAKDENINLKYTLAVLNSKLVNFYYQLINPEQGEALAEVKAYHLENLPIPKISQSEQQPFITLADKILILNSELQNHITKFLRLLERKFDLTEFSKNLQNWHTLDYKTFTKELAKKKIKLSLAQDAEWEDYFTTEQQKAATLLKQIQTTDDEINKKVYALYGLTAEEIKVVEK
ncbi:MULTISPECIES: Eco57I restriction-modification methylase domain-containing protein [unclassified Lonepinella]|uniref:Eco57I restriction-modification methylase domain-containing protein n=1 Tax=unclassified Lonepinella TaxID=2642006 RepID=UPI0036DC4D4F